MKLLCLVPILVFTGCAATRPITDLTLGAGGAAVGHELSGGNTVATLAGGAGGLLVGEGLHLANKKQSDKSFQTGYEKGRSDAVKQQYWLYVSQQHARDHAVRLYPIAIPEQTLDGVTFQPTVKYLRIDE